jgi:hypothetical protein
MRKNRILPMAMMMHYDGQPLVSKDSMKGLLNQVRMLYKIGAGSVQVTVLSPACGTKDYIPVMKSGIILESLDGQRVDDHLWDGNHVISVGSTSVPWKLQRNVLLAYISFYNPINFCRTFLNRRRKWSHFFLQIWGMWGLAITARRLIPWMSRLRAVAKGRYIAYREPPGPRLPIVHIEPATVHTEKPSMPAVRPVASGPLVVEIEQPKRKHVERRASLSKY